MQVAGVVVINSPAQGFQEGSGAHKIVDPNQLFLERAHESLRVRIAFGVGVAGKGLVDAHDPAGRHETQRRRLAAVVGHQIEATPTRPLRELMIHRLIQGGQPVPGPGPQSGVVPHDLLCVPVQQSPHIPSRSLRS